MIVIKSATSAGNASSLSKPGLRGMVLGTVAIFPSCWLVAQYPAQWLWVALPLSGLLAYATWVRQRTPHETPPLVKTDAASKLPLLVQVMPIWQRLLVLAQTHAETSNSDMLHAFGSLSASLNGMSSTHATPQQDLAAKLNQEVEQVLVGFQAQDRLSQMLSNVTDDMSRMESWLTSEAAMDEQQAQAWLDRLYASYTMEEQRSQHVGQAVAQRESAIEFF